MNDLAAALWYLGWALVTIAAIAAIPYILEELVL